jgi:hypothetical protein
MMNGRSGSKLESGHKLKKDDRTSSEKVAFGDQSISPGKCGPLKGVWASLRYLCCGISKRAEAECLLFSLRYLRAVGDNDFPIANAQKQLH